MERKALWLNRCRRHAESIPIYDALMKLNQGRTLYTLRAGAQWSKGANDKALADFNQAIELGYEAAHAFASRGYSCGYG